MVRLNNKIARYFLTFCLLNIRIITCSQTNWTKYGNNPILVKNNNIYEGLAIGSPCVLLENDTLRMFYAAGGTDTRGRINYAYSLDGITWIKHNSGQPVLNVGNPGSWDSHFLDTPEILKDSVGYKLYYFGDTDNNPTGSGIGVAISTDLINWTRIGNAPVLQAGAPGDWDGLFIESPSVIFDNGTYYMLYSGVDTTWQVRIGLATSSDDITWTKYSGNPVLSVGSITAWDGFSIATPTFIKTDKGFELWYCGASYYDIADNNQIDTIKIGYAASIDAIHWTKYSGNPVLSTYNPSYTLFETRGPWAPDVLYRNDSAKYFMWYETAYGFGLAIASDLTSEIRKESAALFEIYPNPAKNILYMKSKENLSVYEIYDMHLKLIRKGTLNSQTLNIDSLQPGTYILKIRSTRQNVYRKIFVKK